MFENGKSPSNCCKYCGGEFQQDILRRILENKESIICEFCGIEIKFDDIDTQEEFNKNIHKKTSNLKDNIKKNKESIGKRIGKLTKSRKYSRNMIWEDKDFPQIFKENLIIVFSRLIYTFIREWEQDNNVSVRRISINQSILTYFATKLKPILSKRIGRSFLENLHNISIEEFDNSLRLLQKKIELNQDYRTHFLTSIIWLQKIVFRLVSDMWEMKNIPYFQYVIREDLKNFYSYWYNSKSINTTNDLLNALRNEIEGIIPPYLKIEGRKIKMFHNGSLPWRKLSLIICRYSRRLDRIRRTLRSNPDFKVALDELQKWEKNINSTLGIKGENALNIIDAYRDSNTDLPISSELKVLNYHPNLQVNYFEDINNKEKAYWLGVLWAEVYLGQRSEISLELSKKDEILVDRYIQAIGLNSAYKSENNKKTKSGIKTYVRIRFKCSQVKKNLLDLGYRPAKLKNTQLPSLVSRELALAFLLGFFDGDGKEGTTTFHLGSKKILDQIKEKFKVPHDVYPDKDGKSWYLSLGGKLFNEMMDNYKFSLERKRKIFRVPLKETLKNQITKEELEKLVWMKQIKEICEKYGIYRRILVDLCDEWEIKRPPSHYWHRQSIKKSR